MSAFHSDMSWSLPFFSWTRGYRTESATAWFPDSVQSKKHLQFLLFNSRDVAKSPARGVVTYRIPKWNKWQLTPNMVKLRHGASFPEPKLPKTWSVPVSLDTRMTVICTPIIKYPSAWLYKWRMLEVINGSRWKPAATTDGAAILHFLSCHSTGVVMHQSKKERKKEKLGKSVTFVTFRRRHLQDMPDHHREVASSPFNQTLVKNSASSSLPFLLTSLKTKKARAAPGWVTPGLPG